MGHCSQEKRLKEEHIISLSTLAGPGLGTTPQVCMVNHSIDQFSHFSLVLKSCGLTEQMIWFD